jgi:hypothetical protein
MTSFSNSTCSKILTPCDEFLTDGRCIGILGGLFTAAVLLMAGAFASANYIFGMVSYIVMGANILKNTFEHNFAQATPEITMHSNGNIRSNAALTSLIGSGLGAGILIALTSGVAGMACGQAANFCYNLTQQPKSILPTCTSNYAPSKAAYYAEIELPAAHKHSEALLRSRQRAENDATQMLSLV